MLLSRKYETSSSSGMHVIEKCSHVIKLWGTAKDHLSQDLYHRACLDGMAFAQAWCNYEGTQ